MLRRPRVATPGSYRWVRLAEFDAEVKTLIGHDRVLIARLLASLRRATCGTSGSDEYVFPLGRTPYHPLVELRLEDEGDDKYRLYHAEPAEDPILLLGLVFSVKQHDPHFEWKVIQNGHIDTSLDRYIAWSARNVH
ncbi:hypothetical protein [Rhodococcus sp. BH5]|uniref:hypothetical protein n=1 Tax=Rhodococcus sp. BH5 TaxID=2871702 RepID=UPI0022CD8DCE|nr:hypothetical protein [Rhodococcus sp. BH5]MCZ9634600.1 hypothetical protein [Rhodococcus sp. BH5]